MFEETLRFLRKQGIRLSRRAGQHQVIDPIVLERMVDYAELSRGDVVLEIGAGIGNLTLLLASRAGRVIAVERDRRLVKVLEERLRSHSNVELLCGDALRIELPKFNKVVANLPYGISSDITFRLLEHGFELAVLMYQREFAERLAAKPGSDEYGRLTLSTHYRASVELLNEVPSTAFFPQPKVTSAMVRLRPREPPFKVKDEQVFFRVIRALFQHRRQRVRNALYRSFGEVFPGVKISKEDRRATIDQRLPKELAEARVMDLVPEKFGEIANLLTSP
ncbi:MAG: 16S rRNA (adenine(1518)-N(6)/adenine(1519)-N(6))-dimethyltransferase RsmA [Candidatus Hodarchaeaceae archaeon]|nr:16S rRNA (adenine(1518)-N(6)/adenine(1519)-N(6))-dimethyltransferase RsmA [Candidatus Hodarchaeaceae archaeon]